MMNELQESKILMNIYLDVIKYFSWSLSLNLFGL